MWCVCGTVMFALMQNENYELFDVMICGKQMMMNRSAGDAAYQQGNLHAFSLLIRGTFVRLNVEEKESHPSPPLCTLFCLPHVVCAIPFLSNTFIRQRVSMIKRQTKGEHQGTSKQSSGVKVRQRILLEIIVFLRRVRESSLTFVLFWSEVLGPQLHKLST